MTHRRSSRRRHARPVGRVILGLVAAVAAVAAAATVGAATSDWRLAEVALIGADPDEPAFAGVDAVAFGEHGDLFVLDTDTAEVVAFDVASGQLLRRIGGQGQGPGEFDTPTLIAASPGGDIYVFDRRANNRISHFDHAGAFIDSASTPFPAMSGAIRSMGAGDDGTFLLRVPSRVAIAGRTPLRNAQLLLLEPGVDVPHSIHEWTDLEVEPMQLNDPRAGITMYTEPQPVWALLEGGRHAVGRSDRYEITILDRAGHPVGTLRRNIPPQPVTDEIKERFLAQLPVSLQGRGVEWGEHLPLITRVFPGPDGAVLVMRGNNGAPTIDVFSAEHEFLAEVALPSGFLMMAARGHLLAGVVQTAEMEMAVQVLRLEN